MKPSKIIVVKQYDVTTGIETVTYLTDAKALKKAEDWISRNKKRMPEPDEIGMVMPEMVIYITEKGDLDASTTEIIDIYHEIDSKGTISIPQHEIDAFEQILEDWGKDTP